MDVVTVGGATIDNIVAADLALFPGQLGGNAIYSAVGATLAGARAGIVTRVPQGFPRAALERTGLDLAGLREEAERVTLQEWFFYRTDGSRADRLQATAAEAEAFDVRGVRLGADAALRWERHLASRVPEGLGYSAFRRRYPVRAEHVPPSYWSARGMHLAPNPAEAQLELAKAAKARGLIVTCDPGFAARDLTPSLLQALLGSIDVFLPSEVELSALRPGLSAEAAATSLAGPQGASVLAKLGGRGCLLVRADAPPVAVPAIVVDAHDPTGAGDAFAGGVLAALVAGRDLRGAAAEGTLAASFVVERFGALAALGLPQDLVMQRRNTALR